jgi:hypothetical protein
VLELRLPFQRGAQPQPCTSDAGRPLTPCARRRDSDRYRLRPQTRVAGDACISYASARLFDLERQEGLCCRRLPLTLESRYDGITDLRPTAWSLLGDLTVSVWPPAQASGTLLVIVQSGHHMVRVRNVDVDYALASPKTAKVFSAIARLRRMSPR